MTTSGEISTKIQIDWDVSSSITGNVKRGIDIKQLFQGEDILGVNFRMALSPIVHESLKGQAFRDWENTTLYTLLDKAANNTSGMDSFELSHSQIMDGLCHLTSACCHVSLYSSKNGVAASGLLYAQTQTFDLYEFLTQIVVAFSGTQVSIEVTPLHRI